MESPQRTPADVAPPDARDTLIAALQEELRLTRAWAEGAEKSQASQEALTDAYKTRCEMLRRHIASSRDRKYAMVFLAIAAVATAALYR